MPEEDKKPEEKPEEKPKTQKEEKALSTLQMAKQLKEQIDKANEESKKYIEELRELRATELLSGRTDAPKEPEKPKEEDPVKYAQDALEGKLPEKK